MLVALRRDLGMTRREHGSERSVAMGITRIHS